MPDSLPSYVEGMLSVLGYQEDGAWVALVLEMDLRGYGAAWEDALWEVQELALTQIRFAHQQGQPEMIWKDAEPRLWERFRRAQRASCLAQVGEAPTDRSEFRAGGLRIGPIHPEVEKISGLIPADADARAVYYEHLGEKHR